MGEDACKHIKLNVYRKPIYTIYAKICITYHIRPPLTLERSMVTLSQNIFNFFAEIYNIGSTTSAINTQITPNYHFYKNVKHTMNNKAFMQGWKQLHRKKQSRIETNMLNSEQQNNSEYDELGTEITLQKEN